jgi:large subunit ribosomal protein L9
MIGGLRRYIENGIGPGDFLWAVLTNDLRGAIERADEYAALLSKTVLTIARQAGEDGRLFGSVTGADVADAIRDARGLKVDKRKVRLESPIKEIGTHMVEVEIAGGNVASVKTMVVASS